MEQIKDLVNNNANGVVSFGVRWAKSGGETAGHSLVAFRDWIGRVRLLDRSGVVAGNLEELEQAMRRIGKTYDGIEKAVPQGAALHVANSLVTTAVTGASVVAVETRSLMLTSMQNANRLFDEFRNRMHKAGGIPSPAGRH